MAKAALCMVVALAVVSCAFAGRVLNEQPAAPPANAPLPADPLPEPMEPPVDPVVVPVPAPATTSSLPSSASGYAGVAPAAGVGAAGGATENVATGAGGHPLTFYMRDIIGGSSQLMVTGVAASAADLANGNNVVPYDNLVQSSGDAINGGYKNIPSVNAASDLPSATTPQNHLFGMTAVVDEELTKGHELGAAAVGRAQGFYVASSQDGTCKTVVLTAMFGGELHGDTLSFFGVHRMAAPESHIAIIGGTGKYENAKGFAAIQSLHPGDQTLLQFDIHLS